MRIPTATSRLAAPASDWPLTRRGEALFWRVSLALFIGGFATFALLYCVQPLLPAFARTFSLSPSAASLSLSAATGVLAVAIFGAGALSDAFGLKGVMTVSLAAAAAATLAIEFAPNWPALIGLRALTRLALSGVPAVAMAYLAEEMDCSAVALAMGLYIAGSMLGGMGGRLAHVNRPVVEHDDDRLDRQSELWRSGITQSDVDDSALASCAHRETAALKDLEHRKVVREDLSHVIAGAALSPTGC